MRRKSDGPVRALLLDFDGVICQTETYKLDRMMEYFGELGLRAGPREIYRPVSYTHLQSGYYDHHNYIIFTGDTGGICDAVPGEPYPENCTVEALRDALKKLEPRMDEIEAVFPGHGMLDQTGETLRYLLHAAEAILEDPERYDEMTERFSPSTGETKKIMMKYIYQGSAIRYNRHNVYKKDQIKGAEA